MNYLIKNANVVNEGLVFKADVLIADGIIAGISKDGENIDASGATVIDARGKYLIPGIIDEHVHFREPGLTQKADIHTESRAAVAGGVTSFMDMPNTVPATVTNELLEEKFSLAGQKSLANYSFYLGATNENLNEVLRVDTSKVCGIKLFMGSSTGNMLVDSSGTLEALFRESPCLIAAHCEDENIIRCNTQHYRSLAEAGQIETSASIHPNVRTAQACFESASKAVELAHKTGARLHVLHLSTRDEMALFDAGTKLESKKITAETCPHYLRFYDSHYDSYGFAIKCNPAIKAYEDRYALLKALITGQIDTIGSDHAPHLKQEKFTDSYFTAKSGFPSVQHGLELMVDIMRLGWLDMPAIVRLMCHNPAIIYGIDRRGFIRKGYHADMALVDMDCEHTIEDRLELTKCGWSPYDGITVHSKVTHTFVNGNLVYEEGTFHEDTRGERLAFNR